MSDPTPDELLRWREDCRLGFVRGQREYVKDPSVVMKVTVLCDRIAALEGGHSADCDTKDTVVSGKPCNCHVWQCARIAALEAERDLLLVVCKHATLLIDNENNCHAQAYAIVNNLSNAIRTHLAATEAKAGD